MQAKLAVADCKQQLTQKKKSFFLKGEHVPFWINVSYL